MAGQDLWIFFFPFTEDFINCGIAVKNRLNIKETSGRVLKDRHRAGSEFLRCAKISHH